jgi:hypothetical protein
MWKYVLKILKKKYDCQPLRHQEKGRVQTYSIVVRSTAPTVVVNIDIDKYSIIDAHVYSTVKVDIFISSILILN